MTAKATVGAALPPRTFGPVTMTDIVRYQGASGDMNPMHHDDDLARSAGYPAAFSVGMLGAGYLATYCTDLFGTETVRQFRTRFRSVVYRGDSLHASGRVVDIVDDGQEHRVQLEVILKTDSGATAVDAFAEFAL